MDTKVECRFDLAGLKALMGTGLLVALFFAIAPVQHAEAAGTVFIGGSTGRSDGYYVPGHYEDRAEIVLVEDAHTEKRWMEPEYKTVKLKDGTKISVKVSEG